MKVAVVALLTFGGLTAASRADSPVDAIPVSGGELRITFFGHASLMFQLGSMVIDVDPVKQYVNPARVPKADLILITHEHSDHLDPATIAALSKPETEVIANERSAAKIPGARVMKNGDSLSWMGIGIEAVPAYNLTQARLQYHPKGRDNGYVLTIGGKRVYVAGDTEDTPEMRALKNIDIAFLPMNLPFTMTARQVASAAKAFKPKVLYPYHTGDTDVAALEPLLKDQSDIELRIRPMK